MARLTAQQAGGQNRLAFLDMIRNSEIGPALIAATDEGYNVLVGATPANPMTFPSYADHPNVLNAALNSTAAGGHQLLHLWWADRTVSGVVHHGYKSMLNLPDFSPTSQERVALQQIRECNALSDIDAGNFAHAVALCSRIWASLPGNDYGQHQNQIALLQGYFTDAGGTLSSTATA
jgi:muramidase (phage lysozyme)